MVTLNIDMPTNCMNCPLLGKDSMYCHVYPLKDLNLIEVVNSKPEWCPIIAESGEEKQVIIESALKELRNEMHEKIKELRDLHDWGNMYGMVIALDIINEKIEGEESK